MTIQPITKKENFSALQSLKYKKAPGYDLITTKILKEISPVGITLITYIFNAILQTHSFPIQWKMAQVTMILKPGKRPDLQLHTDRKVFCKSCPKFLRHYCLVKALNYREEYNSKSSIWN